MLVKEIRRETLLAYVMKVVARPLLLRLFRTATPIALVNEATCAGVGEYCRTALCSRAYSGTRPCRESPHYK